MRFPGDAYAILDGTGNVLKPPKGNNKFLQEALDNAPMTLSRIEGIDIYKDGFFFFKNERECIIFKRLKDNEIVVTYHSEPVNPFKINTLLSVS